MIEALSEVLKLFPDIGLIIGKLTRRGNKVSTKLLIARMRTVQVLARSIKQSSLLTDLLSKLKSTLSTEVLQVPGN